MAAPLGAGMRRHSFICQLAIVGLVVAVVGWFPKAPGSEALGFLLPPTSLRGSSPPHATVRGPAEASAPQMTSFLAASAFLAMAVTMSRKVTRWASKDGKKLEDYKEGDEVSGKVVRVATIGTYIDIGAEKDALLTKAEMQGAAYKDGDQVTDLVISQISLGSEPGTRKIRVSMSKSAVAKPNAVGSIVDGVVVKVFALGATVKLGDGKEGLIPRTQWGTKTFVEGDTVKVKITKSDGEKVTLAPDVKAAPSKGSSGSSGSNIQVSELKEGQEVTGTLMTISQQNYFFDIGTLRPALCRKTQMKDVEKYTTGDKVTLRVLKVEATEGKVELTMKPFPKECKVGDKLEGFVKSVTETAVFFDVGYCSDVMAPRSFLAKDPKEYTTGSVSDLIVVQVSENRITVSTKDKDKLGKPISQLVAGQPIHGKILRVSDLGLFIDIGCSADALFRAEALPKDLNDYKEGQELDLIVLRVNVMAARVEVTSMDAKVVDQRKLLKLENLPVGTVVSGTVKSAAGFGVFVDIGAERDALYDKNQLEKPISEYKVGDTIEGLKVVQCDPVKKRLSVSKKGSAADWASRANEIIKGTVLKVAEFGVFVDIGASCDALMFKDSCNKELSEYKPGDVLDDLQVGQVNVESNKISVLQVQGGQGKATVNIEDLQVKQQIQGVVRLIKDYGIFISVGTARDALLPANLLPRGKTVQNYKVGDVLDVYIIEVDAAKSRITVSTEVLDEKDPRMKPKGGRGDRGENVIDEVAQQKAAKEAGVDLYHPMMMMTSDLCYKEHPGWARVKSKMDKPFDWNLWGKKYPEFVTFPDSSKNNEDFWEFTPAAHDYDSYLNTAQAKSDWIPIPAHLRRPDAGPQEVENDMEIWLNESKPTWDVGIKPEIHVKYRQPPHNFPNWTWGRPEKEDQEKWTEELAQRAKEREDAGLAPAQTRAYGKVWLRPEVGRVPRKE